MAWHLVPGAQGSEAQALEVSVGTVPVERGDWLGRVDRGRGDTPLPTLTHPRPWSQKAAGVCLTQEEGGKARGSTSRVPTGCTHPHPEWGLVSGLPRREIGPGMPGSGPGLWSRHPESSTRLAAPLQCYSAAASVMLILQEGRSQAQDGKQKARTCLRPHSKLVLGLPFGSTLWPAPSQKDQPGGSSHCPLLRSCWGSGNSIHA